MPDPSCKFQRSGDLWVMVDGCVGEPKECPPIPNSITLTDEVVQEAALEVPFLANLRNALHDETFEFMDGDELELNCTTTSVEGFRTFTYHRGEQNFPTLLLIPVEGEAPQVEPAEG